MSAVESIVRMSCGYVALVVSGKTGDLYIPLTLRIYLRLTTIVKGNSILRTRLCHTLIGNFRG